MTKLTVSSKHQVVIPKAVRNKLDINSGDQLIVDRVTKDSVVLKKAPTFYDLIGSVPRQPGDPVERIRQLRDEWQD